ncbi:protein arginine N-methyltransferase 5 [Coccinella septempunctata]|uniref:protein arginine N-methyltransferase 5 n=1 Tax=Coccinella septempunctata TaxID=41139 RepID=UPI001D0668CA|nr:protein arginine N-methyltransferase 5 [Coccinella septempunctata]
MVDNYESGDYVADQQNSRKPMSTGLHINCPHDIKSALQFALDNGYHFVVTQITHPGYSRNLINGSFNGQIARTDRVLKGSDWGRLIVAELTRTINVDSDIEHVRLQNEALLEQELAFAYHLGVPAIQIHLQQARNTNLAKILYEKILSCCTLSIWLTIPMVHPSNYSKVCEEHEKQDSWEWWNDFRTLCRYDKRIGLVLELPDIMHIPSSDEIDRWLGEPVKALSINTSLFVRNIHGKTVLPKRIQDVIQRFMSIDVQYIIKSNDTEDISVYNKYLSFLGRKLYNPGPNEAVYRGMEDYLQNPLQPLSDHLDSNIYEVFEKDQIKYTTYQNAIQKALQNVPEEIETPVLMVVGPGRGPLIQASLNVSHILHRPIKVYAIEKNPYAYNTLLDRVENEWDNKVVLVNEDMRVYNPPEKADIIISELLGSFGDNELSPECLDGAQRFLKKGGISVPASYSSYIAPIQSTKIYNEIHSNRQADKTILSCLETPYVVHLVNFYQIDNPKPLFTFIHPNWDEFSTNKRFKRLSFHAKLNCLLTGFVGFFDTVLYGDIMLSTNPKNHTPNMASWFPIHFPLPEPMQIKKGDIIEIVFWRCESKDKVWYEWCVESPRRSFIVNPNGRSNFITKIC